MERESISRGNSVKAVSPARSAPCASMVTPRKPRHKRFHYGGNTDDAEVREIADPGATLTGKLDFARVLSYTQTQLSRSVKW